MQTITAPGTPTRLTTLTHAMTAAGLKLDRHNETRPRRGWTGAADTAEYRAWKTTRDELTAAREAAREAVRTEMHNRPDIASCGCAECEA